MKNLISCFFAVAVMCSCAQKAQQNAESEAVSDTASVAQEATEIAAETKENTLDKYLSKLPEKAVVVEKNEELQRIFFFDKLVKNDYRNYYHPLKVYDVATGKTTELNEEADSDLPNAYEISYASVLDYVVSPNGKSIILHVDHGGAHAYEGLIKVNKRTLAMEPIDSWTHFVKKHKDEFVIYHETCTNEFEATCEADKRYKYYKMHYDFDGDLVSVDPNAVSDSEL